MTSVKLTGAALLDVRVHIGVVQEEAIAPTRPAAVATVFGSKTSETHGADPSSRTQIFSVQFSS